MSAVLGAAPQEERGPGAVYAQEFVNRRSLGVGSAGRGGPGERS